MAPGPGGTLYLSIPRRGGSVLALLGSAGRPRSGWPIAVNDSTSCELLLPLADGSVRVVSTLENPDGNTISPIGAFAFASNGRLLAGWPVRLGDYGAEGYYAGRVIGDELTVYAWATLGDARAAGSAWIMTVAADGAVRNGTKVASVNCCEQRWAIGPDGVAYGSINHYGEDASAPKSSELLAVSFAGAGAGAGFPIAIGGIASEPAFDAVGRIHVTGATEANGWARTFVHDPDGRAIGGSGNLRVRATDECVGIEGSCEAPAAPLVGPDGTTFVIDAGWQSTTVAGVGPSGLVMAGWPYRSDAGHQSKGTCPRGVCEGYDLALPAIGPDNIVYLVHSAATTSVGGSIVAVGANGRVRAGWPVELRRPGDAFWSVVVGSDGTAFALAIESEGASASSATILAIAPDSTVLYRTTVINR
jgi:hypothetical protein